MSYLNDKRRRLGGRELTQPGQGQNPTTPQKQAAPAPKAVQTTAQQPQVQPQTAAPKVTQPKTQAQATPAMKSSAPAQTTGQDAVTAAQNLLNQQLGSYQSQYGSQIDSLIQQLQGQQPFEYDVNADPLYLQLRDQWMHDGKLAMEDTMGQAARLTGGYGNSYAQTAGQQVYNGYLRGLNEMIPQLKEAARADYDAENDWLMQQLGLLMDQDNQDYSRWMDELNRHYQQDRDALADKRYDREWEYQQGRDQIADERYRDELAYGRGKDAYDRLLEMIATTGYKPTAEELAAAGMSEAQAKAWLGYWQGQQVSGSSGGSGGGGSRGSGGGSGGGSSGGTPGSESPAGQNRVPTPEELGDPFKKEDYTHVYANCAVYAGNGAPASELAAYIKQALNAGSITQEQYNTLMKKFGGLADTGKGSSSSGSGGKGSGNNNRYNAFN